MFCPSIQLRDKMNASRRCKEILFTHQFWIKSIKSIKSRVILGEQGTVFGATVFQSPGLMWRNWPMSSKRKTLQRCSGVWRRQALLAHGLSDSPWHPRLRLLLMHIEDNTDSCRRYFGGPYHLRRTKWIWTYPSTPTQHIRLKKLPRHGILPPSGAISLPRRPIQSAKDSGLG